MTTPDDAYLAALRTVVANLGKLRDEVAGIGAPSVLNGRPDHLTSALAVTARVLNALPLLGLNSLVWAALRADHATARLTPGQLLDRATSALSTASANADAERLADTALRGAGVL